MEDFTEQVGRRHLRRWARWAGALVALCAVVVTAVALTWARPAAEAQSVGERQRLIQWERRRTEAIEKQARAADRQARALEDMARRLASIERACGRR